MGPLYFYDTCAILNVQEKAFENDFLISYITLLELENIKTSRNKSDEVKYKARNISRLLGENTDKYDVIFSQDVEDEKANKASVVSSALDGKQTLLSMDVEIIKCVDYTIKRYGFPIDEIVFVTDDMLCKFIAKNMFGLTVVSSSDVLSSEEEYLGYKEIEMSISDIEDFYSDDNYKTQNNFGLLENQYLIVKIKDQESDGTKVPSDLIEKKSNIVATYRWSNGELKKVGYKTVKSSMFGDKMKPKDIYQSFAIDSILNNKITAISGKAGSGKSLISLMTIMHLIESGSYDRVVVMFNPTKARGASDMGFYAGNAIEKAMQNSIGKMLTTKFGDTFAVDYLIQQQKLSIVSMADARGMEIKDNEILYITECQNTTADLLKLCLERASEKCKIIIEGDYTCQVDSYLYEGSSNGMKRAIDVLKGDVDFGYVSLPNIWRSRLAELVSKF